MLLTTAALEREPFHNRFRMILWKEWMFVDSFPCCCAPKDAACWKTCGEPRKYQKEVLVKEVCMCPACTPPWNRGAAEFCPSFSTVEKAEKIVICYVFVNSSLEQNFYHLQWRRDFALDFIHTYKTVPALWLWLAPGASKKVAKACNRHWWDDWSQGISLSYHWTLVLGTNRED